MKWSVDEPVAPAERADLIVDFRGVADGTTNELINIGPTDPTKRNGKPNSQAATDPVNLILSAEPVLGAATATRQVSLNELDSEQVCVTDIAGSLVQAFDSGTGNPLHPEGGCEDSIPTRERSQPSGPICDIEGFYVWHCRIVEHEDNETMRP